MNALPYFLTASLYLVLFIGCYWLLLRRNTFFGLNRAYLLGSVILSLTLPFLDLSAWWNVETQNPVSTITLPTFRIGAPVEETAPTTEQGLWLLYGLGVLFMFGRLVLNLRAIVRLIQLGTGERRPNYTLVRLPDDGSPISRTPSFSFGRYLVLNAADAQTELDALLRHEAAHIRQHHTADVLFMELVRAVFWFNPVLWLYKRALQEVHEFLADRAALQLPDQLAHRPEYARQLVAYALNVPATALTTPFSSLSTLKQRIVMLQKPQSNRRVLLGYALVLPLAGLLTLCTQPDRDTVETERSITTNQPARQAGIDGEVFTVVENLPEFPGGMKGLGRFISQNLRYPAAAQKVNAQGRVFVSFIVTKEGDIADVRILKDIGFGTGGEAVRVVKAMPRWQPARQSGQVVNVRYNLPINFELEESYKFPKNLDDVRKNYKTFKIDEQEVSFDDYVKTLRSAVEGRFGVEGGYDEQTKTAYLKRTPLPNASRLNKAPTINDKNLPVPPPPPVPANDAPALDDVKQFTINGKPATKAEVEALSPNAIARVDVTKNKMERTVAITTK